MHFHPRGTVNLRPGLLGWFLPVRPAPAQQPPTVECMHEVRQAMLDVMVAAGLVQPSRLSTRILYCTDVTALWHMRSELMQALASANGELHARHQIDHITELFNGLVSTSLTSRPAPLR
ncbi:MAG: hypothetical protein H7346_19865 [Burkholderiaceae bacterium]|nr:hypothetical protein [Burkholderiaceae bacterium]